MANINNFNLDQALEKMDELNPEAIIWTGLDEAIIGVVRNFQTFVFLYSFTKIIDILIENMELSYTEALEHYSFNIIGGYLGESTPEVLEDDFYFKFSSTSKLNNTITRAKDRLNSIFIKIGKKIRIVKDSSKEVIE